MSETKNSDRKSVREFFAYQLNQDALAKRGVKFGAVLVVSMVGLAAGYMYGEQYRVELAGALVGLILFLAIGVIIDRVAAGLNLTRRRRDKEANHERFRELAERVRAIQSEDVARATLRVFERSQLDRNSLRVLQHQYHYTSANDLFDVETPKQILGDLYSKSNTFMTRPAGDDVQFRDVYWEDTHRREHFFNPVRVVVLYLTETQMVVCDVTIDSSRGDLKEEILRISLANVVSMAFSAERKRDGVTFESERDRRWAKDQGLSDQEIEELRRKIRAGVDDEDEWVREWTTAHIQVTRTDGRVQSLPVASLTYFGKRKSALDDESLTEDEIAIDRMVNELNRLVENSARPGGEQRGTSP